LVERGAIKNFLQLIGRVHADPDFLPRSGDFSLNQQKFLEKFCTDCPEQLYRIAFMCCDLNPDRRFVLQINYDVVEFFVSRKVDV